MRLLDAGADDYLVKPFNTGELIARMKVAIRHHAPQEAQELFVSGRLTVDLLDRVVKVGRGNGKAHAHRVRPAAPVRPARRPDPHPPPDPPARSGARTRTRRRTTCACTSRV